MGAPVVGLFTLDLYVGIGHKMPVRTQAAQLVAMFLEQLIDFLDALHGDVAAQGVILEAPFHGQQRGFGQAGIDGLGRQADVIGDVDVAGNDDFARFDHEHIGAQRGFLLADVRRSRHIANHGAWLALGDVYDALAEGRGGGDDQITVGNQVAGPG